MIQLDDLYVEPNVKDYILNQSFLLWQILLVWQKKPTNINKGFFLNDLKFTKLLPFLY
jgi:hypothetical protein